MCAASRPALARVHHSNSTLLQPQSGPSLCLVQTGALKDAADGTSPGWNPPSASGVKACPYVFIYAGSSCSLDHSGEQVTGGMDWMGAYVPPVANQVSSRLCLRSCLRSRLRSFLRSCLRSCLRCIPIRNIIPGVLYSPPARLAKPLPAPIPPHLHPIPPHPHPILSPSHAGPTHPGPILA